MHRWLSPIVLAVPCALFLAPPLAAQVPKVGDYYTDDSQFGYELKMPKGWEFVPPQPGETSLIGTYDPKLPTPVSIGVEENVYLHGWLVKFDRRPKPEPEPIIDEDGVKIRISFEREYRDIADWIDARINGYIGWHELESEALKLKDKTVEATQHVFSANGRSKDSPEVRIYSAVYSIAPEVDVAVVFLGPGTDKKWRNYQKTFEKLARTFRRVEVEELDLGDFEFVDDGSPRSKKLKQLYDEMRRTPGWELYETPNYLIISNNPDKQFIKELMERIEKIRDIYTEDYPPELARRVAVEDKPKTQGSKGQDDDDEASDEDEQDEGLRSVSVQADPFAQARASVLRVCKDQNQYHSYGGPGGSAGYWSSRDEELVIYDDKAGGGRSDTWAVLNHEAFHQYIFYFYGKLSPHSWYNEGTGDFYSGYEVKGSRFKLTPFAWRVQTVKDMLRTDKYVPLEELVRFSQAQYYGNSDYGTHIGQHYAQGWSFIYFMRTGPKKCRDWNDAWDHILGTYLETLAESGDLDHAVDVAFDGVDWEEMETAWKKYTLK